MSRSVFLCRVNGTDFYGSPLCLAPPELEQPSEDLDVHAGGQLRLGAAGDQLELLPLEDSAIPADATVPPTPAELELERRRHPERSTTL